MDSTLQSKHTFDPCALLNALEHRGQGTPHGSNVFNVLGFCEILQKLSVQLSHAHFRVIRLN